MSGRHDAWLRAWLRLRSWLWYRWHRSVLISAEYEKGSMGGAPVREAQAVDEFEAAYKIWKRSR